MIVSLFGRQYSPEYLRANLMNRHSDDEQKYKLKQMYRLKPKFGKEIQ